MASAAPPVTAATSVHAPERRRAEVLAANTLRTAERAAASRSPLLAAAVAEQPFFKGRPIISGAGIAAIKQVIGSRGGAL